MCLVASCASSPGEGPAKAATERPPGSDAAHAVVVHLNETFLDVARRSEELGTAGREAALREVVLESFDLPVLARASLGPAWNDLDADQRAQWTRTYTEFHIAAAARSWDRDRGARFVYLGEVPGGGGTVLVETRLDRAGTGADVRRDYRLREVDGRWRIIDLYTPGAISTVAMRRSEYEAYLSRHDFASLIEHMQGQIEGERAE